MKILKQNYGLEQLFFNKTKKTLKTFTPRRRLDKYLYIPPENAYKLAI